ncbi:hypothetical protein [Kamptonema sp. UHCC 0994]|uniref:hypothetical protein n=1 Tax=Kamptonema sp. UHCC 0994 TaxID=3031329 RepID=UPI0023B91230|nr:hypothetical protein [Kamptonema sp. UHCC 0994]MDF0553062.1 hypothetical protein [Kamptonema sp. UHCC 0994]
MFDISFYAVNGEPSDSVRITESIYEWLAKSQFAKIGISRDTQLHLDGEDVVLPVVELNQDIRQKLRDFFRDAIISQSETVLTKLGDYPSKQDYQQETYYMRKLLELLKCVENENYHYLQRV